MTPETRQKDLRRYFSKYKLKNPLIIAGLGFVAAKFGFSENAHTLGAWGILAMLAGLGWIAWQVQIRRTAPTDNEVDNLLAADLKELVNVAHQKTNLLKEQLVSDELIIRSPILWYRHGISPEDIVFHKGKDNYVRFGIYKVAIFLLADHLLAVYMCDYNFIRKVALNERTEEYHYKDVVSVTTQERSANYTMKDGQRMVKTQAFRLSVSSGENIEITINAHFFTQMTRGEVPATGAEKAVNAIRAMLREKKV